MSDEDFIAGYILGFIVGVFAVLLYVAIRSAQNAWLDIPRRAQTYPQSYDETPATDMGERSEHVILKTPQRTDRHKAGKSGRGQRSRTRKPKA